MRVLSFILRKEFRQIRRNKSILVMMFVMPLVQLVILPLAMDFDVKSVNISIVDHDHSTWSQQLISKIMASGYFKSVGGEGSYKEALQHIEYSQADLVLEIPQGFEKNLVREKVQQLGLAVDAINGTKAAIGAGYLGMVIKDFATTLDVYQNNNSLINTAPQIDITYTNWFNPLGRYKYNVVPAVLVLLLTMIGGYVTALNIVREKEIGTIEQINVTPIKKWEFILGKLIPFLVIGLIVFTVGLFVCWALYGIIPRGNLMLLYAFATMYMIAIMGFGLLVSTYSDNQVQAMFVAFFFMMIFMLMSGFFTAVESMPAWARLISDATPVTHFIKVDRMIVLKGSGWEETKREFLYLLLFAFLLNGWAVWNYRKTN